MKLNFQAIRTAVDQEPWVPDEADPENIERRGIFLGTVTSLTPSGKYHTFFACSNLSKCVKCKGTGCDRCGGFGSAEAWDDAQWYEDATKNLDALGLGLEHGEADPCDVFVTEYRDAQKAQDA